MEQQANYQKPKASIWDSVFKVGVLLIIAIIGGIVLFGFIWKDFDPVSFIINILGLLLMLFLLGLAIKGVLSFIQPKPFSPTEDFRTSLIRISKKAKPFNVKNLILRGEDMRTFAKWGKIIGVGFLPYISFTPQKSEQGKVIYETDKDGNIIYDRTWSQQEERYIEIPKPKYEYITEKDGDVLIVTERYGFPLNLFFRDLDLIRANPKYLSDLIGDVFIKDVNLVPYGEYLYPAKQWQDTIIRIMKQNEDTTVVTTHRNNLDYVSTVTQMSLGLDPTFQKIMLSQAERLSSGFTNQEG